MLLTRGQVIKRCVAFLGLLIDPNRMAVREGAAAGILATQTHAITFQQQGSESQGLGGGPVEALASLEHLLLLIKHSTQLAVDGQPFRNRGQDLSHVPKRIKLHRGLAPARVAMRGLEARPLAVQPVGLVRLVADTGFELLIQVLVLLIDKRVAAAGLHHALGLKPARVDLTGRGMRGDLLVHRRLGEHRLVTLVMAESAITDDVEDHVDAELLAKLGYDAGRVDHRLGVIGVHVKDRRHDHLGDIGRIGRRAREGRRRGETDLVVDDHMDRSAGAVAAQLGKIESLGDDPLAGEGGVAMHQQPENLLAIGVAALRLLGPDTPHHHRVHDLQMRRVRVEREMHHLVVEGPVGGDTHMVLHVAGSADFLRVRRVAEKLGNDRPERLVHEV